MKKRKLTGQLYKCAACRTCKCTVDDKEDGGLYPITCPWGTGHTTNWRKVSAHKDKAAKEGWETVVYF